MRIPTMRTVAMPADTNPRGDIFGGWIMSQMDLAGGEVARRYAKGKVATVAVSELQFHKPVFVGDYVSCFADIVKAGTTSITIHVETFVERDESEMEKVTEGTFVFVAIDENRRPRPLGANISVKPEARIKKKKDWLSDPVQIG